MKTDPRIDSVNQIIDSLNQEINSLKQTVNLVSEIKGIYSDLMNGVIDQKTSRRRAERLLRQHGLPPGSEFFKALRGYIAAHEAMEAHQRGDRRGANALLKKAQAQGVRYGD